MHRINTYIYTFVYMYVRKEENVCCDLAAYCGTPARSSAGREPGDHAAPRVAGRGGSRNSGTPACGITGREPGDHAPRHRTRWRWRKQRHAPARRSAGRELDESQRTTPRVAGRGGGGSSGTPARWSAGRSSKARGPRARPASQDTVAAAQAVARPARWSAGREPQDTPRPTRAPRSRTRGGTVAGVAEAVARPHVEVRDESQGTTPRLAGRGGVGSSGTPACSASRDERQGTTPRASQDARWRRRKQWHARTSECGTRARGPRPASRVRAESQHAGRGGGGAGGSIGTPARRSAGRQSQGAPRRVAGRGGGAEPEAQWHAYGTPARRGAGREPRDH
jgi:hypothetical protein